MKKLLFGMLFLSGVSYAAPVKYVQISTGPVNIILQPGTTAGFWVSSGTVNNLSATTATIQNINNTFIGYGRNRVINGDMHIDQRMAGKTLAIPYDFTNHLFQVDRFYWTGVASPGGLYNATQLSSSSAPGFTEYTEAKVTTANTVILSTNTYLFVHRIEGNRVKDFNYGLATAQVGTLSFWVRSSTAGTLSGSLVNVDSTRSYPFSYVINQINTWEKKIITIPGDTTGLWSTGTLTGMKFSWNLGNGSNFNGTVNTWASALYYGVTSTTSVIGTVGATWDITGIQWEMGPIATNFEYLPESEELRLCQRFFEKSYDITTATATATSTNLTFNSGTVAGAAEVDGAMVYFKVTKRVQPIITLYSSGGVLNNWTWTSSAGVDNNRTTLTFSTTYGFQTAQTTNNTDLLNRGHWCADAEY